MKKSELVAPGGSLRKIEYAYHFGADATYVGLPDFSLRARINEFTPRKLKIAVELARKKRKKIYFTLNIYAHERHLPFLKNHLKLIAKLKPDALIISDPGIIRLAKKLAPRVRIHLSTQANTTNSEAVRFWQKQGVSRIILAREVTLEEIKKIRKACPKMELEYFVHGAMCMSLSGRCLLSSWMRGRSANLGDCVQPCRWPYRITRNVERGTQKEEKIFEIQEDEQGAYLLNSKDLCLIEYLDKLAKAGIGSFKIEGRTKSVYYVAGVVRAYRQVLDAIRSGKRPAVKKIVQEAKEELEKLVNHGYSSGFLFGKDRWENDLENSHQKNAWQFVGEVMDEKKYGGVRPAKSRQKRVSDFAREFNRIKVHNALSAGEKVEIVTPEKIFSEKISEIKNAAGEKIKSAHGGNKNEYFVLFDRDYPGKSLIRKKV